MHAKQGWTIEQEDGNVREVRVTRHGGQWRFQSRLKGEGEWLYHDPPLREDVETLRDMLHRKYMRRRASLKTVQDVDNLLSKLT